MSQGVTQTGGTIQGQSVPSRPITITGELLRDAAAKRKHMLDVIVPEIPARLIYNDEWFLNVVPTQTPIVEAYPDYAKFQFQLVAAYPYWQSTTQRVTQLAGTQPLFRFPWNPSNPSPFLFSKRKDDLFTIYANEGSISIPFTLEFKARGTVTNPKVMRVDTREFIRIEKVMQSGKTLTFTHTNDDIALTSSIRGSVEDAIDYLDFDSDFFLLDAGETVLRHDADSNSSNLDVRLLTLDVIAGVS